MALVKILLIDGSGSMRPAWDTAWELMFNEAQSHVGSFSLLIFRDVGSFNPWEKVSVLEKLGEYCIRGERAVVINVARLLGGRILRRPPNPPVQFRGWTPLNEAICLVLGKCREQLDEWGVDYSLHVFSDNRSSRAMGLDPRSVEDVVAAKRECKNLKGVYLHVVGESPLLNYLDPYDAVVFQDGTVVNIGELNSLSKERSKVRA